VVLGELGNRPFDHFTQVSLTEKVIRSVMRVFELNRTVFAVPVFPDCLEQHQRVAAPVSEFVFGQIRRNCVDPGGKLLLLVKSMKVSVDSNENLLNQVF
jgi:hypothetical protein